MKLVGSFQKTIAYLLNAESPLAAGSGGPNRGRRVRSVPEAAPGVNLAKASRPAPSGRTRQLTSQALGGEARFKPYLEGREARPPAPLRIPSHDYAGRRPHYDSTCRRGPPPPGEAR